MMKHVDYDESALRSPWRKPGRRSWICKLPGGVRDPEMPAYYASAKLLERRAIARFKYGK